MKTGIIFCLQLLTLSACQKSQKVAPTPVVNYPPAQTELESTHFEFTYDSLAKSDFESIKEALESSYTIITDRYQVKDIPKIRVVIYSDVEKYNRSHNYMFNGSSGYVFSREEIRVLFIGKQTVPNSVHEFTHAITLFVSGDFGNNPRWLWESVAVYEAGQLIDPKTLPYMVSKDYPSLQTLSGNVSAPTRVYEVGYTLAEFIIKTWGYPRMVELIKSHGNVQATLNVSEQAFEAQWHKYLETNYLKN